MLYFFIRFWELVNDKIKNIGLRKYITRGNESKFFATTQIHNIQKNKSKIVIGKKTSIRGELLIFKYGGQIMVGDNCYIGENNRIWSGGKIVIGNNILIAHNINIHDNNAHPLDYLERRNHYLEIISKGHPGNITSFKDSYVTIHDDAWIGLNTTILKGVTIGEGAIVAPGSVITKDILPFTVVGGNPAGLIKQLMK